MKRRLLGILAYLITTFPLGYYWHFTIFTDYYKSLEVYRENIVIPLGFASMLIQGFIWSILYEQLLTKETVLRGAVKFAALAFPLAWSFMVLAVAAKHHMASVSGFVAIETVFLLVQYTVFSPLLALVYSHRDPI
jgi:hypothetical protein